MGHIPVILPIDEGAHEAIVMDPVGNKSASKPETDKIALISVALGIVGVFATIVLEVSHHKDLVGKSMVT